MSELVNQTADSIGAVQAGTSATAATDEQGKLFAILSYVVPFFLILPLVQRVNGFAVYHAKQALVLWLACFAAGVAIGPVLMLVPIALLGTLISLAFTVASLGLVVLGILNAVNLRRAELPVIGCFGQKWFAGLTAK